VRQIVVDTNVLLSFLTDRNVAQGNKAEALMSAAAKGEVALVLPQIVLGELVYVLRNLYNTEATEIARTLDDLLASPGVFPADQVLWSHVLELWPGRIRDFADAVLASMTLQLGYDAIATFDRAFVRQLKRENVATLWSA